MADIIIFPNAVKHPEFEAIEHSNSAPAYDDITIRKASELARILIPVVNRMTAYCLAADAFSAKDTSRMRAVCEQAGIDFSYVLSVAEKAAKDQASGGDTGMPGVPTAVIDALMHLAIAENAERAQANSKEYTCEWNSPEK